MPSYLGSVLSDTPGVLETLTRGDTVSLPPRPVREGARYGPPPGKTSTKRAKKARRDARRTQTRAPRDARAVGHAALICALAEAGAARALEELFACGLSADARVLGSAEGPTALHVCIRAFQRGQPTLPALRALLQAGACLTRATGRGVLPAHVAAEGPRPEPLGLLLAAGSPRGARCGNKQTLLHWAARHGSVATLRLLLTGEPHPGLALEARDRWHRTALHWAVLNGHPAAVRVLLAAGASVRDTQIRHAAHRRQTFLVQETPLHLAARTPLAVGAEEPFLPLRLLLEAGADPNALDQSGGTPLHTAAEHLTPWTVEPATALCGIRLLLEAGADPRRRNAAGETAALVAARQGSEALMEVLEGGGEALGSPAALARVRALLAAGAERRGDEAWPGQVAACDAVLRRLAAEGAEVLP